MVLVHGMRFRESDLVRNMMTQLRLSQSSTKTNGSVFLFKLVHLPESFNLIHGFYIVSYMCIRFVPQRILISIIMHTGDVASSEMVGVLEPFEVFDVPPTAKDKIEILEFAQEKIPHYNPKHFYAYYEFTGHKYVTVNKNVMALNKVIKVTLCNIHDIIDRKLK